MKRFAVLAMVGWFGGSAFAGDVPTAGPPVPQVPPPIMQKGLPTNTPTLVSPRGPRTFSLTNQVQAPPTTSSSDAPVKPPSPPAPAGTAASQPLPPLPTGITNPGCGPVGCATPTCSPGSSGSCFEKMKRWLCFRECTIHMPLTPAPCYAPYYSQFQCKSTASCGHVGCGPTGCSVASGGGVGGTCATPSHRLFGNGGYAKTSPSCDPKTGPVDAGLPGYRFAVPEHPAVVGAPPTPSAPVRTSSFQMPAHNVKPPQH